MNTHQPCQIVAVRACPEYAFDTVRQAVMQLADDLGGGWRTFIPPGARVLIKPNLLKPATADEVVSPHPMVVRAVIEACRSAGAGSIRIGDSPGFGSAEKVCHKCGILAVARELDVPVVEFSESVTVPTPEGFYHRSFTIAREVAEADVIINLPKFKTHAMMFLTLAVKNLYGALVGKQKARWHFQSGRDYNHFARLLLELAYTVKPAVSILDAVIGMEGNGPGSGTPRQIGCLAASRDMVSLDRVAVAIAGVAPERMHTLRTARAMGLTTDLGCITVTGDDPGRFTLHDLQLATTMHVEGPGFIRLLSRPLRRFMTTRPQVDRQKCCACGICAQACPAECMRLPAAGAPVAIDAAACIRCFCCQELCPEGAITAHDAIGVRLLKRLGLE